MAIVFPTLSDQEILVQFATISIECSKEEIEILKNTCSRFIADIQIITDFILKPSTTFAKETPQLQLAPDSALPPVHHYCGGILEDYGLYTSSNSFAPDMFCNAQDCFRPHEVLLRLLQRRLQHGKDVLTNINKQHNYAFTVVTVGKGDRKVTLRGRAVTVEQDAQRVSLSVMGLTSDKTQVINSSENDVLGKNIASGNGVCVAFTLFIQAFDISIQWVANILQILDGEGTIPAPGTYIIPEQVKNKGKKEFSREENLVNISAAPKGIVNSSFPTADTTPLQENQSDKGVVSIDLSSVDGATFSSQARRRRTIRITRYEMHDISNVFLFFKNRAGQFYLREYTFHDPRLQCRLLSSEYYLELRETIRDINLEIGRLRQLGESLGCERSNNATIVFSPTISQFCHLRDSLRLYLSFCITGDDLTAFFYYRMQYNNCVLDACKVMEMLKRVCRPSTSSVGDAGTNIAAVDINHNEISPTPFEHDAINASFESFWRLRESVLELQASLVRDIEEKDRTHRYRVPQLSPETQVTSSVAGDATKKGGFVQWTLAKVSAFTQLVTCGAELYDGDLLKERDDEGFLLSIHSPLYGQKTELLCLVRRVVSVVETQATLLEQNYPGEFYRDLKTKWARRADAVVRHLESMSVVFSSPK